MTSPTNYQTFYTPPSPLPTAAAGYVMKSEPSNLATMIGMVTIAATATRVMYLSADSAGNPQAVTGTYFEPTAPWAGIGDRPLSVMAPGTMGLGDQCAPSRLFNQVVYCGGQKNIMAEYQAGMVAAKTALGIAVFVTDYGNVGTSFATGKNCEFANRKAQAHAVIDGAKAALNLPNTSLDADTSKIVFWGYSQGGGAAGAAAELLATYGSSLTTVVGAYCGAPPSNYFDLVTQLDKNMLAGLVGFLINGFKVSYPSNVTAINSALTPLGVSLVTNSQTMCILELATTYGFQPLAPWFASCMTLDDVLRLINFDPFYTMLNDQAIGLVEPSVPIMIDINVNDPLVTHDSALMLAQRWCALGANVQFYTSTAAIPTLGLQKTNLIHFITAQTDDAISLQWIQDRFNGVVTAPNCSTIGSIHTASITATLDVLPTATIAL